LHPDLSGLPFAPSQTAHIAHLTVKLRHYYAKQTQSPMPKNQHNPSRRKDLRRILPESAAKKQTQSNPIPSSRSQDKSRRSRDRSKVPAHVGDAHRDPIKPNLSLSRSIGSAPGPTQPFVHLVIPTEGTLPASRSGGIRLNPLATSPPPHPAQIAKEFGPQLRKTNPIL